jgi:hypothetical protein
MDKKNVLKNGGFPPLKYCKVKDTDKKDKSSKERFFFSAPVQNINIRQLLADSKKKALIITDENTSNDIEVIDTL